MLKQTMIAFALLLVGNFLFASAAEEPDVFHQTLSVGGIAATVRVYPSGTSDFQIHVRFHSAVRGVSCLSAYRDVRYQLRDSRGQTIAIDQGTLAHPPAEEAGVFMHVVANNAQSSPDCDAVGQDHLTRAFLSALYPHLAPGAYTLEVSLAPRGSGQSADFAPISITIK